jgi:hypothetical protein
MRKTLTYAVLCTLGFSAPLAAEPVKEPSPATQAKSAPTSTAQPTQVPMASALPTPLSAELFRGPAREAYKAAAEIPDVFAGLACYCGCNKSYGHRHLLDCFTDDHGAG